MVSPNPVPSFFLAIEPHRHGISLVLNVSCTLRPTWTAGLPSLQSYIRFVLCPSCRRHNPLKCGTGRPRHRKGSGACGKPKSHLFPRGPVYSREAESVGRCLTLNFALAAGGTASAIPETLTIQVVAEGVAEGVAQGVAQGGSCGYVVMVETLCP